MRKLLVYKEKMSQVGKAKVYIYHFLRKLGCDIHNVPDNGTMFLYLRNVENIPFTGEIPKRKKAQGKLIVQIYQHLLQQNGYIGKTKIPKAKVISVKEYRQKKRKRDDDFFSSREWQELRYRALTTYGRRCMCCGATPKDRIVLHVDHIKPRSKHPDLELSFSNLQVLCEACNMGKSNKSSEDFRTA
ncbi:MAG: HNH endonuclease [Candidatus Brocadiaceae bacterium]|nr:HNH endonuclease [Candidatus Brocadiaceae bacterium]